MGRPASRASVNVHRRADRLNLFSDKLINLYQLPLAAFSQLPNLLTLNRSVMRERPVGPWNDNGFHSDGIDGRSVKYDMHTAVLSSTIR